MIFEREKSKSVVNSQFFSVFKSIDLETVELWRVKLRKCWNYAPYNRFWAGFVFRAGYNADKGFKGRKTHFVSDSGDFVLLNVRNCLVLRLFVFSWDFPWSTDKIHCEIAKTGTNSFTSFAFLYVFDILFAAFWPIFLCRAEQNLNSCTFIVTHAREGV